ncbi:hypothetical protein ACE10Z_35030 [Bradyrhizobium sp. Pha-3]|uniref:hypothetical protein n=1 Tax=Bradyrhizobium sp. Pha-3 TaxID=208375 RepID=UPI0035D44279
MLISSNIPDERLTTAHRAKLACVYVRQSSVNQVRQHQESTELQYRLVDRAIGLGWPPERVQVIDEDLGKSGAGGVDRHGFQKLIAEIGLGNAGLVVSLDASRWPAITGTGNSFSNCARYSACSLRMVSGFMIRAPTTTACYWACPAS